MDTGTLRDELVASIRLPVGEERWLAGGAVAVLIAYGIWVGATAAALTFGVEFAGRSLTIEPWTTTTTAAFGVGVVAWVLVPAAVVTYGVSRALTNVSGNIARCYRFDHPSLLVLPPLALFGVVGGVGIVRGTVSTPLAAVLVVAGALLLVRTVAYSYRVFSLSVPELLTVFVFISALVVAVALLTGAAALAGQPALFGRALEGVEGLVGIDLTWLNGSTTLGSVTLPTLQGLAAGVPAALSVLYLTVQTLTGVVFRLWAPDVPRSNLRTGQRYPRFARPTTAGGAVPTGAQTDRPGDASGPAEPSSAGEGNEDDVESEVPARGPGDTRLFTPPPDGGEPSGAGLGGPSGVTASQTAVVGEGGNTIMCPACGERVSRDAEYTYCPACGTPLQSPET